MDGKIDDKSIAFWMGSVNAQLAALTKSVDEERVGTAKYRAELRDEIKENYNTLKLELAAQNVGLAQVIMDARQLREMKPIVESLATRQHEQRGAFKFGSAVGRVAYIAAGAVGAAFMWAAQYLVSWRIPPH